MEFTDAEIREELSRLGYRDVPDDKLQDFKKDLMKLIQAERSKTNSLNSSLEERQHEESPKSCQENVISDRTQWRDPKYTEDWQYKGRERSRPATAGPFVGRKNQALRSFGLFEQPVDLGFEDLGHMRGVNNSQCYNDDDYCCYCSEDEAETKQIKRKTVRTTSAGQRGVDESTSDCDAAGIYELYERVRNLAMRDCECGRGGAKSADEEPPYRIHGVNKCPSLIRKGEPPHTRNLVKTLPWKRHQMYQRMWKAQPVIGEDNRNRLRKEMQAKMLQKQDFKLPRKVYKPNKYVPPPENPRYKLRWDVRRANSQYEMPCTTCRNNPDQNLCI